MSSSYISFREKGFWCRDSGLEVWLRLLALNLKGGIYDDGWKKDFRDQLLMMSSGLFRGMISVELDEYLGGAERNQYVLDASKRLRDALGKVGSVLPGSFLNLLGGEGVWGDSDVAYFLNVADRFVSLLQGEEVSDLY